MKKLNLGCGTDILDGYENYDLYSHNTKVKKLDLNKLPLDLPDNYADKILLSHVLEHLSCYYFDFMKDIHRVLKPGGKVIVKLPVYCNIIQHTQSSFGQEYLGALYKGSIDNLDYAPPLFSLVKLKKHKSLKDIIGQLKNRFVNLFNTEYEWELVKE